MTALIFAVNNALLPTSTIGKIESATYSSVIRNPDAEAIRTPGDASFSTNGSATLNGLLIGLGLEYAFTNSWTVKFEYDYLGFPAKDVLFTTCLSVTCTPSFTATQSVSADKHIFKVGFNYLFNYAPVVAKY